MSVYSMAQEKHTDMIEPTSCSAGGAFAVLKDKVGVIVSS